MEDAVVGWWTRIFRNKFVWLIVAFACFGHWVLLFASYHQGILNVADYKANQVNEWLPRTNSNNNNNNNELSPNHNKTLVILIGGLRGGETTWATIHKHVLNINQADLAIMMDAQPTPYPNATLLQRAKYVWTAPQPFTDWADAMELIPNKPDDWRKRVFGPIKNPFFIALGGANGVRGSGAIIFMLRYFASKQIRQLNLHQRYDRFIITRSDNFFVCPHDISEFDPDKLWVPRGQNWRGICDRHLVVPARYVLAALDIISPIVRHPERYINVLRGHKNTEQVVKLRWEEEGLMDHVLRFERNMFLAADAADQGGWKKVGQKKNY